MFNRKTIARALLTLSAVMVVAMSVSGQPAISATELFPETQTELTPGLETTSNKATAGDEGLEALAADCATDPAAGSASADVANFDPTKEWGRQDVASCVYTCPGGMVALCPDRIDHMKSCVNDCCVLTAIECTNSCNTHADCGAGQICHGGANCCYSP